MLDQSDLETAAAVVKAANVLVNNGLISSEQFDEALKYSDNLRENYELLRAQRMELARIAYMGYVQQTRNFIDGKDYKKFSELNDEQKMCFLGAADAVIEYHVKQVNAQIAGSYK